LLQPGQPTGRTGQLGRELIAARQPVLMVLSLVGLGGLPQDLGDLLLELGQGAVGPIGGIGGHLRAVQGDYPEADQSGRRAQLQRRDQEAGQGLRVASPKPRDRHVVRRGVAGQRPEGEVLDAASLDLPRGPHPDGVGVQQHAQQRLGVVGRMAMPIGPVGTQERRKVDLVNDIAHEPGEMVLGQPVARVRGEQERLVAVAAKEVISHGTFYTFT
jgi:hypothetical protein